MLTLSEISVVSVCMNGVDTTVRVDASDYDENATTLSKHIRVEID